jgi:hypothetical protein
MNYLETVPPPHSGGDQEESEVDPVVDYLLRSIREAAQSSRVAKYPQLKMKHRQQIRAPARFAEWDRR